MLLFQFTLYKILSDFYDIKNSLLKLSQIYKNCYKFLYNPECKNFYWSKSHIVDERCKITRCRQRDIQSVSERPEPHWRRGRDQEK